MTKIFANFRNLEQKLLVPNEENFNFVVNFCNELEEGQIFLF